MYKVIQKLLFLFCVTVVPLILLEVFIRVFDPIGIRYYFEARRYFHNMSPDPDFGYIHPAGYHGWLQGVEVKINSEGLRGPEFQTSKPEGSTRLLVLGDSVVFGWGAPQDSTLPAHLQSMANDRQIQCEVIAAGVGSWNTRTEYEFLKKRGISYDPDILLLVITANDAEPNESLLHPNPDTEKKLSYKSRAVRKIKSAAKSSYIAVTIYHIIKTKTSNKRHPNVRKENSTTWQDARDALSGIVETCHKRNIRLVVFFWGNFSTSDDASFSPYIIRLRELGIPFHALEKFSGEAKYFNSKIDHHLNGQGNRLVAEEMFEVLLPILLEFEASGDSKTTGEREKVPGHAH